MTERSVSRERQGAVPQRRISNLTPDRILQFIDKEIAAESEGDTCWAPTPFTLLQGQAPRAHEGRRRHLLLPDISSFNLQHQRLNVVVGDSLDVTIAHLEEEWGRQHGHYSRGKQEAPTAPVRGGGKKIAGGPICVHLAPLVLDIAVPKALITTLECQDSKQEFTAQHAARTPSARLPSIKICYSERRRLKPPVRGSHKHTEKCQSKIKLEWDKG